MRKINIQVTVQVLENGGRKTFIDLTYKDMDTHHLRHQSFTDAIIEYQGSFLMIRKYVSGGNWNVVFATNESVIVEYSEIPVQEFSE